MERANKSRLMALLTGYDYTQIYSVGIVTSENPQGRPLNRGENRVLLNDLKEYLSKANYVVMSVMGKYGNKEHSLIIQNPTLKLMRDVGIKFDQESMIYGEVYEKDDIKGMKFQYWQQGKKEVTKFDSGLGKKILVNVPDNIFSLVSTRYSYIKADNFDDYFTEYNGFKFQIPFFDKDYKDVISEGEYLSTRKLIDTDIDELHERVSSLKKGSNKTKKSIWEARGVIKLMMAGEYRGRKFAEKC